MPRSSEKRSRTPVLDDRSFTNKSKVASCLQNVQTSDRLRLINMIDAIRDRRSIRKYKSEPVRKALIDQILQAGILAPSSKNRQPWKFIVATESAKDEACWVMEGGIRRERSVPFIPESHEHIGGAEHTVQIMKQAPVLIFVVNPLAQGFDKALSNDERVSDICNSFFAQQELSEWAGGELYAILALGYPDEAPGARPRKNMESAVEWRGMWNE